MNDQYGNPIPADLTMLQDACSPAELTEEQLKRLDALDWYCIETATKINHTYVFVSQSKLEEILDGIIDNFSPEEVGFNKITIAKIDAPLHRWNEHGFYWA